MAELQRVGLLVDPSTNLTAGEKDSVESLGFSWWMSGYLTVQPAMALRLFENLAAVLATSRATPHELSGIIGHRTWALLLRRALLSILDTVCSFAALDRPHCTRVFSDRQIGELEIALDWFPLVYENLARETATCVYASDASLSGGAAADLTLDRREINNFLDCVAALRLAKWWCTARTDPTYAHTEDNMDNYSLEQYVISGAMHAPPGFRRAVDRTSPFSIAVPIPWKTPQHINVLQLEAALLSVLYMG